MLRQRVGYAVGVDRDEDSVAEARAYDDGIEYLTGQLESVDLPLASFDVVSAVAMLHHVDHASGLRRLADFVAPGGVLLVVGLATSRSLRDYSRDALEAITIRRHTFTKAVWETSAPKLWPPPLSYSQANTVSLEVLPEADFQRVPYFRYGLTWCKNFS